MTDDFVPGSSERYDEHSIDQTGVDDEFGDLGDLYVVIDIGCLECSEPSELVGVFDLEGVRAAGATPRDEIRRWGGQGVLVAFKLPNRETGSEG